MRSRVTRTILVTITEGPAVFLWLYFSEHNHPWWHGILALWIGEVLETGLVGRSLDRAAPKWPKPGEAGADGRHRKKVRAVITGASIAEIGIWVAWLEAANAFGQAPAGALVLLVLMHVKHHAELAVVRDIPFKSEFFAPIGLLASAMEVGGAVGCLALLRDGEPVWAATVLALGFLIEHATLVDVLQWEAESRDIRIPRDKRWRPPTRIRGPLLWGVSHFPRLWRLVDRIGPLRREANRFAINFLVDQVEPRPNPLSTMAAYTSWTSLTDRTWSGRHLPPVPAGAKRPATLDGPPSVNTTAELFKRGEMKPCPKSTVLFTSFAQWFTDGFLRTTRELREDGSRDTRRNESTHEIDLAQLYGLDQDVTRVLRTRSGGQLKSQTINGEEYPEHLCHPDGVRKLEFLGLPVPLKFDELKAEEKAKLFAMGTDTRNLGFISFNVLFLREHNRIARELADEYGWSDDDQLFETARMILTVILLKVVVEDYINHINPGYLPFRLTPGSFPNEAWHRPNWMAIEFNLLYRWHSLTPDVYKLTSGDLPVEKSLANTDPITSAGLGTFMQDLSRQPAGRIGLFNTPELLVEVAEKPSIRQARNARLASYNDYRRLSCLPPARSFEQITSDPAVLHALKNVYKTVEDVEFYPGLFAEEMGPDDVLPPLMLNMVAFDAFSQALTNPLLAPRVFTEATFTVKGMEIIKETSRIADIVNRNCGVRGPFDVTLTRRGYRRGKRATASDSGRPEPAAVSAPPSPAPAATDAAPIAPADRSAHASNGHGNGNGNGTRAQLERPGDVVRNAIR